MPSQKRQYLIRFFAINLLSHYTGFLWERQHVLSQFNLAISFLRS